MRLHIALLLSLAFSSIALAQGVNRERSIPTVVNAPEPQTYGTASETVHTVGAWAFEGWDVNVTSGANADHRFVLTGCCVEAPVNLPNGALVIGMELEACDSSSSDAVYLTLNECGDGASGCSVANRFIYTGSAATPGCNRFSITFAQADQVQINNNAKKYLIELYTGPDASTSFGAVRLRYKLQVSPAPAIATFTDVSNAHPFYQYIEALAASGITGGCNATPPQYCPDVPITRGQMAVFLARALGLHFPN
jgi:S-layer family protein